uniref:Uncharacterized protein n=1 Tax=Haptolina brevifila TaxID=156173 RepID=A0A7S2MJZ2_9EUKA
MQSASDPSTDATDTDPVTDAVAVGSSAMCAVQEVRRDAAVVIASSLGGVGSQNWCARAPCPLRRRSRRAARLALKLKLKLKTHPSLQAVVTLTSTWDVKKW